MKIYKTGLIQIKKLKNLAMYHDLESGGVWIENDDHEKFFIPKEKKFAVLRGLVSDIQRFYRRKIKIENGGEQID